MMWLFLLLGLNMAHADVENDKMFYVTSSKCVFNDTNYREQSLRIFDAPLKTVICQKQGSLFACKLMTKQGSKSELEEEFQLQVGTNLLDVAVFESKTNPGSVRLHVNQNLKQATFLRTEFLKTDMVRNTTCIGSFNGQQEADKLIIKTKPVVKPNKELKTESEPQLIGN